MRRLDALLTEMVDDLADALSGLTVRGGRQLRAAVRMLEALEFLQIDISPDVLTEILTGSRGCAGGTTSPMV